MIKEIKHKSFYLFSIRYGHTGGAVCKIANHIILEKFETKELKRELKKRERQNTRRNRDG